eukprot:6925168-Prymnesium_polylepis.1
MCSVFGRMNRTLNTERSFSVRCSVFGGKQTVHRWVAPPYAPLAGTPELTPLGTPELTPLGTPELPRVHERRSSKSVRQKLFT